MKGRNCPNCGAVYEIDKNKCPYCGTSYYDMSAIDFTNGEPFYLKIRTNLNGQSAYITQLVKPNLETIEITSETVDCYGGLPSTKLFSYESNRGITTNISFRGITDKNGNLFTVSFE